MDVCARFHIYAKRKICTGNEGNTQTKIADVVRPTSIIVHKDKNHYGSKREGDIESIYRTLEAGELHEFKEISIAKADFLSYVHGEGKLNLFSLPTSHLMQLNLCLV